MKEGHWNRCSVAVAGALSSAIGDFVEGTDGGGMSWRRMNTNTMTGCHTRQEVEALHSGQKVRCE